MKKSRSILRALLPPLMSLLLFAGLFELGVLLVARSGHVLWSALVAHPPAAPPRG